MGVKELFSKYNKQFLFAIANIFSMTCMIEGIARGSVMDAIFFIVLHPLFFLCNMLVVSLLYIFLIATCQNNSIKYIVFLLVCYLFAIAARIKFDFKGTGFSFTDFNVLHEIVELFRILTSMYIIKLLFLIILGVILFMIMISVTKDHKPIHISNKNRIIIASLSIFNLYLLFNTTHFYIEKKQPVQEVGNVLYFIANSSNITSPSPVSRSAFAIYATTIHKNI